MGEVVIFEIMQFLRIILEKLDTCKPIITLDGFNFQDHMLHRDYLRPLIDQDDNTPEQDHKAEKSQEHEQAVIEDKPEAKEDRPQIVPDSPEVKEERPQEKEDKEQVEEDSIECTEDRTPGRARQGKSKIWNAVRYLIPGIS